MNLLEGAAIFAGMVAEYEESKHKALEKACVIIETEAKHVLGTYEYGWPPLADATRSSSPHAFRHARFWAAPRCTRARKPPTPSGRRSLRR
jgi:hypothetical protein